MNLEQKFLNAAAAQLVDEPELPVEGDANFRGPVPPAAQLEAPTGEIVLTPDSPEAAARIAAGRSTPASIVGQEAPTAKPASAPSLPAVPVTDRVFPEYSGSIQSIPRNTLQEMMGNIGSAIQSGAEYLDFAVIGLPDVGTLTLKDLTVGDLGKVMEAMSYGFYPVETKSAAGIPLLMPTAEALDLLNAIPAFQAANKAIQYGAKGLKAGAEALAPAAADVIESGLRKTGMIMDIVPDGKSVIKPEDIKLVQETQSDWIFELPNGTRKTIDKFEYLSDVATMGQYAPSKEQMILSAKKEVAQMAYEQANKQVPKSEIGFYSAVENAAMNVQRNSGAGQSFLNDIMKGDNVKPEEIKWMGLDDFLKGKKNVTKQEVQDFIANNKVDVQEVKSTVIRPLLDNGARPVVEGDKGAFLPKFGKFQLAGGENYRELLLTMPSKNMGELDAAQKQADLLRKQTADLMADWKRISEAKPASGESQAAYVKVSDSRRLLNEAEKTVSAMKKESGSQTYSSEHFTQPNILAHLRVNDRLDADGKKMLLIEEVQSDWHQAGRDVGYAKNVQNEINAIQKQMDELGNQRDPVTNRITNEKQWFELGKQKDELIKQSQGVPDAPFKDTWYQLALKRALQYASENGYERVGLTTGKQQIDRYSNAIRQNVDQISFYPFGTKGGTEVYAKKDNKVTFRGIIIDGKFIDGEAEGLTADKVLGKSMVKQITEKKDGVITGDNLSIGGEGMKKYYDEAYPNFLDKYSKKWNAKIGETKINPKGTAWKYGLDLKDTDIPVRYVDITPEMKAGVKKGQPLFAAAPIGAATGAATMQDERKK
jgi:hypothetical protein